MVWCRSRGPSVPWSRQLLDPNSPPSDISVQGTEAYSNPVKSVDIAVRSLTCHTATGTHMPYRITWCYLPPDRGDIPAFTPAEAGT